MPPANENLILIGMPAVGKSTLGVLLAKRLGFAFVDTDLLIQAGEGDRLQGLIGLHGIEGFCDLEAAYIQRLAVKQSVIATGGSVVYRPKAMAHLDSLGTIVWLAIDLGSLTSRLKKMDSRGVVHLPGQTINQLYAKRMPLYRNYANIIVETGNQNPDQVVQAILNRLKTAPLFSRFVP